MNASHRLPAGPNPLDHLDALYRVALRLTRRREDADDLVQETFAKVFAMSAWPEPDAKLKAWLFRVLKNTFLDRKRREFRSPFDDEADAADAAEVTASPQNLLRGDAELDRLRRLVGEEIEEAIGGLPLGLKTVLLLDLEGLGEDEIAEIMDCAPGTVKSRLFRARSALREKLADYRR